MPDGIWPWWFVALDLVDIHWDALVGGKIDVAVPSAPFERSPSEADLTSIDVMALCLDHDFAMVGVARRTVRGWLDERDGARSTM